jgi:hypothetical protein
MIADFGMRIAGSKQQAKIWKERMNQRFWIGSSPKALKSAIRNLQSAILMCALLFALSVPADGQQPA